jgi:hypothetical protein
MKNLTRTLAVSTLAVLAAVAHADPYAPAAKTLQQSQAEYIAARQNGELPTGFAAMAQREMFQGNALNTGSAGKLALAAAQPGTTPLGFVAKSEREIAPGNFGQDQSTLTRTQVRAQMIAARNAGDLPIGFVARSAHDLFPGKQPRNASTDNIAAAPATTAR